MIAMVSVSIFTILERKEEVAFYFQGEDTSITLERWSSFSSIFIISFLIIFFFWGYGEFLEKQNFEDRK